jgi:ArsR family transcriptional regulator
MRDMIKSFKALSDGTRLRILNILMERECCVCEVMQVLEISQPSASRHLSALYEAGLLNVRKEGIWTHYSVDWDGMPEYASEVVKAVRLGLIDNKIAQADRQKLKSTTKQSMSCANV